MIYMNLQFFGGRGSAAGKRSGGSTTETGKSETNKPKREKGTVLTEKSPWEDWDKAISNPSVGDKLIVTSLDGKKATYTYNGGQSQTDYIDKSEGGPRFERVVNYDWVLTKGEGMKYLPIRDAAGILSRRTGGRWGIKKSLKKVEVVKAKK